MGLVIDACVLRASGTSGKPVPSQCRAVLEAVRDRGRVVNVSKELMDEWREHKSNFASLWITSMFSRRLINVVSEFSGDAHSVELALERLPSPVREIAHKDVHILKLAVDGDKLVVSQEEACRMAFCDASEFNKLISEISWIKPEYELAPAVASGAEVAPAAWLLSQ